MAETGPQAKQKAAAPKHTALRHIALLRGVNVGGKNRLPMKDLIEMFLAAGCGEVQTYLQSGNVVFSVSPSIVAGLPTEITARIAKRFGFSVPVVLRTANQLGEVLAGNPFLRTGAAEETLHVMFLAELPSSRELGSLDPNRSPGDAFLVRGREIYLQLPNGVARSKLTNDYFDSKLATTSTARNWRTVTNLYQLTAKSAP